MRFKVDVLVAMVCRSPWRPSVPRRQFLVFGLVGDAVGAGIVPSLARPAGNAAGMSLYGPEVFGKGFELLKEAVVPG
jgi:hypothetical protein